jgi:hypothetical protein
MDRNAQLKAWRAEAKTWILEQAAAFIQEAHSSATTNPEITVGQVVAHLDEIAPVAGYELLRSDSSLRYQVVRSVVESAAKEGRFDVGSTVNSRGRDSKCFSPAGWRPVRARRVRRPSFDILVEGSGGAELKERLQEWLTSNVTEQVTILVDTVAPADLAAVKSRVVA